MSSGTDRKQQTHARILETAAARFRAEGLDGVGVAKLMQAVGLTHGGFYAHFDSKDALVEQACQSAFEQTLGSLRDKLARTPQDKLATFARRYLDPRHRDHPETGCFAAALASEVARGPLPLRQAVSARLGELLQLIDQAAADDGLEVEAAAVLAQLAGALVLSRIATDPALSDRFLAAGREAVAQLAQPAAPL